MAIEVNAPAVVKLSGEHIVVYTKDHPEYISVAVAISLHATAKVDNDGSDKFTIRLEDFNKSASFTEKELLDLYGRYKVRPQDGNTPAEKNRGVNQYIEKESAKIDPSILPFVTIAGRLASEQGISLKGVTVTLSSNVPMSKGCASSATCSTAFTVGLLKLANKKLDDAKIIDIARDGERVVHKNEGAGMVDVTTSYFGGYASTANGGRREDVNAGLNIVVIDTGPKKPTSDMVKAVGAHYTADKAGTEAKFAQIVECVNGGLDALRDGNAKKVGEYADRNHKLLSELGVSSPGLDKSIAIAKQNGAYGGKLSGGGGGGVAIAVCNAADSQKIIKAEEMAGFKAFEAKVEQRGARSYLVSKAEDSVI